MRYIIVKEDKDGKKSYLFSNRTGYPEWVSERYQARQYKANVALMLKDDVKVFTMGTVYLEEAYKEG